MNWNSGNLLRNCLSSIKNSSLNGLIIKLIIIDNNSKDHSLDHLANSLRLKIIKNSVNKGFAAACNQALKLAKSKYILLLNPDTEVKQFTLLNAIKFMEKNTEIAVLGCKQLTKNNKILPSCSRFPNLKNYIFSILGLSTINPTIFHPATIMTDWDHQESRIVDHINGAFMLMRKTLLAKIGYFDERFFMYLEDLDFSLRINKAGYLIYYSSEIEILHLGGGISEQIMAKRLFYSLYSRILYAYKHFTITEAVILTILILTIEPLTRCIFLIISNKFKEIGSLFKGYYYLLRKLTTKKYMP